MKVATASISDEDSSTEIEPLLPQPAARAAPEKGQCGRVCVRVHRADGLPRTDAGLVRQIKSAVDVCRMVDPYVRVSFAGIQGSTSKRKRTPCPEWNEQLVFTCPFPLPLDPVVLQVRDDDCIAGTVIGTTLVHLDKISNPRKDGFLPTFGPCFVYLHDQNSADPSYKGRLLISIATETSSEFDSKEPSVELEPVATALKEGSYGFDEEFLLFACIQEATIDKKVGERGDIRFTLQMGEIGRDTKEMGEDSNCASPSIKPVHINNDYLSVPFAENMPCVWLKGKWPDNRKRMYASNILHKMAQKLKDTLKNIRKPENTMAFEDKENNKTCLKDLTHVARDYLKSLTECFQSYAAKTQLDNERLKICQSDIEDIVQVSLTAQNAANKTMLESALNKLQRLKRKMKMLADDPQCMLPDVLLWLECGGKRVAFARIPARRLLFAMREHERGDCSATTTDFYLTPTSKSGGSTILIRLKCYLWLGLTKNMQHCFHNLPAGFTMSYATVQEEEDNEAVPRMLRYNEQHFVQLRAHLHQARLLPSLDVTRSPGCYARVLIGDRSLTTQVKEGTVNPIWDEMLQFRGITFYGEFQSAIDSPPIIVVEVLDGNAPRESKLLGRAIIDSVNMNEENPPTLQWFSIQLNKDEADEQLLAAFEMSRDHACDAQDESDDFWTSHDGTVMAIPNDIRPKFSMHRIEILFWGLREMRRFHWRRLNPRLDVECAGQVVQSCVMPDYARHSNFVSMMACMDMDLPDNESYLPSLVLRLTDVRSFGRESVVATHVVHSLHKYAFAPRTNSKSSFSTVHVASSGDARLVDSRPSFVVVNIDENIGNDIPPTAVLNQITVSFPWTDEYRRSVVVDASNPKDDEDDDEELDWWSRYYISTNQWPAA